MNFKLSNFYKVFCKYKAEILSLIIYVLGVSVISYFHEPWFDEAQAWQIARTASLKEILFSIPHDEGHPQLWHLILCLFAKTGAPYLISIKLINIVFCSIAIALLLFKSPFPRLIKCLLPFSYFFFYQYGVISRPYSIMMMAFFLIAITYKKRDEKPLPYILSLTLLCASQLYGILFAGMFCIVWVVKILAEYKRGVKKQFIKDKRFYMLFSLLIFAVFLIYSVLPHSDTYNPTLNMTILDRLKKSWLFFVVPFDSFFGLYISYEEIPISGSTIVSIIFDCLGGLLLLAFFFYYGKKTKMLSEFAVPVIMFLIFAAYVYVSPHHIGLFALFTVYYLWIDIEKNGTDFFVKVYSSIKDKIDSKFIKKCLAVASSVVLMIPIAESGVSSVMEVKHPYDPSAELAKFIKEHDLDNMKIFAEWGFIFDFSGVTNKEFDNMTTEKMMKYRVDYPYIMGVATTISPYFDENIVLNYSFDDKDCGYTRYRATKDVKAQFEGWSKLGVPEIIISDIDLQLVFDSSELEKYEFVRIAVFDAKKIYKFSAKNRYLSIYMRNDVLDEHPDIESVPL